MTNQVVKSLRAYAEKLCEGERYYLAPRGHEGILSMTAYHRLVEVVPPGEGDEHYAIYHPDRKTEWNHRIFIALFGAEVIEQDGL